MKLKTSLANHGMMEQNGNSKNSSMNELELLLQEKHNVDNNDRERDLTIHRSGSAPPTVQGSLDAIGSLCRKPELGKAKDGGGCTSGIMSEEEMRSHPAYLAYYYSHDNINPRMPPPLLSKEEWRMQQRIRGNGLTLGAIGDLRKKGSMNIEDNSSFFLLQPAHYVQNGENGVIDSSSLLTSNLSPHASNEWNDKSSDGLVGLRGSRLGGRRRSFADILQDGLDRPASLTGPLSSPASRTAFGDLSNSADLCDRLDTEEFGLVRVKSHSSMVSHLVPTSAGYPLPIHSTPEVPLDGRSTISSFSSAGGVFPGRMNQNINGGSCSSSWEKVPDIATSLSSLSLSESSISIAEKLPALSVSADHLTKDGIMKNSSVAKASFDGQLSFPKRTISSANQNSQHCSLPAGGLDGIPNHFQNAKFASSGCTSHKYSVNQNFNSVASYHLNADLTCNGGSDNHVQPNNCLLGIDSSHLQSSSYATCTPSSQNCASRGNFVSPPPGELVGLQKAHLETLLAQHKRKFDLSLLRKSQGNNGYYEHPSYELGMEYEGVNLGNYLYAFQPVIPMLQNHRHFTSVMKSSVGGSMGLWNTNVRAGMDGRLSMTLLEELKNNKTRCFELSDIVGHVVEFSMDQCGSRFIQQKLETAAEEEKVKLFPEIVPHARTLMTDVFGNYVIQKLFEHSTGSQRKELTIQLTGHVLALSLQMYGCRVIQKALEMVDLDEKIQMVGELKGSVMKCVRDQNGNHVIQKCIECVPEDRIQFIISTLFGQVIPLSTHPYGCRVIQRVLEHCHDPSTQKIIMDEIMQAVCHLAHDQYGNYVIQHVLRLGKAQERSVIISKLAGQIVKMSQQKFASNVIEKCLAFGSPQDRQLLVDEMLGSTDENEPLQAMMKDQFGNYVVQKVLETSDVETRELIVSRIKVHLNALKKYMYGKHIVARVEKLLTSAERRTAPP